MTNVDDDTGVMIVSLACLIFATDQPDRQSAQERAIGLAHWWRERSYGEASRTTKLFRDRVHVILADFYRQRVSGDPEDNLNDILVYTDSLDLEPHDAPYHWGLGKLLRGFAYARRQEWKNAGEPAGQTAGPMMDVDSAIYFFQASLETLKHDAYPWEWAHALLYWSDAIVSILPAGIEQTMAEGMTMQLRSAEEILTPLVAPVAWARIQRNLSEISRRPLSSADPGDDHDYDDDNDDDDDQSQAPTEEDDNGEKVAEQKEKRTNVREDETDDGVVEKRNEQYFGDPPIHILARAQLVLDGDEHGCLRAGLEIEKARYFVGLSNALADEKAISAYRTGIASLPETAIRERFSAFRELGGLLFARGAFAEAADAYEKALDVGQARLESSYSMNARRVAIFDLRGIAHDLAFCHLRAGNLERAIITLDEGKSILLNDNLRARYASRLLRGAGPRSKAVRMASKLRRLEAEAYGGMQYSESTAKLIELRGKFSKLDVPPRAAFSLRILRELPDGCVIVAPVVTRHGTSVILATGVPSGPAALSAVEIPALTDVALKTRLFAEGAGWFDAYRKRNEYGVGEEAFTDRVEDACDWLGETLFAPLIAHLDGQDIRELILVPSGGLQFLPLHAASLGKGSEKSCLVEHFVVRAVPSLATLALLQSVAREGARKGSAIVAGVSVYNDVSLNPLPNAVNEVKAVAEILGAHPILDEQVTPSTLAAGLKGTSILHLACHGAAWAEDIGFDRSYSPSPVLRLRKKGLSFRDILVSWDLESTELVTLSACDTGLVTFSRSSDEFEGLAHILLQAGARRVVASLWSVDDQSTALLMRRFYANLRGGLGYAAALTHAQKWLRSATHRDLIKKDGDLYDIELSPPNMSGSERPFAHPIYWAPFFLTG
jgi:CHAT domain-containing protein/tetratricopeptide (TPR) repeat protein